ncbi:MAG: hypothetical protein Q8Q60_02305 [Candidatus Chromulinivorax sp.]|nr:hypothetical protein [Candidatus Chromulinivorax sp.]
MNNNKNLNLFMILCMITLQLDAHSSASTDSRHYGRNTIDYKIYNEFADLIDNNQSIASLYYKIAIIDEMNLDDLEQIIYKLLNTYENNEEIDSQIIKMLKKNLKDIYGIQQFKKDNPTYDQAELLIAQSYVSPETQYAILQYVNNDPFTINVITGKIQKIPSIDRIILGKLNDNNDKEVDSFIDQRGRLNALHAALESVKLAQFVAGLNVAYANPEYLKFAPKISSNYLMPPLDPNLIEFLNQREQQLIEALGNYNSWGSWVWNWSWIPTSLTNMFTILNQPDHGLTAHMKNKVKLNDINNAANFVAIPDKTMKEIVKHYDYKQIVDHKKAAELLWKQCFIAQQNIMGSDWPIYCSTKQSSISATHYIFDTLEIDGSQIHTLDALCNHIRQAVHKETHSPRQAHTLLLQIRKAVQTAMFIANKNSSYNIGYQLPTIITQSLDKIVGELNLYDQKLNNLCQNDSLGAIKSDQARTWNAISAILTAGIALGGTVAAVIGGTSALNYGYNYLAGSPSKESKNSAASTQATPDQNMITTDDPAHSVLNFLAGTVSTEQ